MLNNPFTNTKHRVFAKTFLDRVRIGIVLSERIEFDNTYIERMSEFSNRHFRSELPDNASNSPLLRLRAKGTSLEYQFDKEGIIFQISGSDYVSFDFTLKSVIETITSYLTEVLSIDKVEEIFLEKVNKWEAQTNDSREIDYSVVNDMIHSFLKSKYADQLILAEDETGASKTFVPIPLSENNQSKLFLKLSAKVINPTTAKIKMYSRVTSHDIVTDQIGSLLQEANTILFDFYVDAVAESLIKFQESKE